MLANKEGGCVDQCVDTVQLEDPLIPIGSEGSALTCSPFLFLPRMINALSLFYNNDKRPLFLNEVWQ